jgi:CheY-like chemotaxis protein/HPt (histidine-containing phosphotransfer) domain-containing protein
LTKRILIVDDNATNRKYARSVLKNTGWQIEEVEDGESALRLLAHSSIDLILMDIQMPGMDGFECLKRIQEDLPHLDCPVLAVTAFSSERDRNAFSEAGFKALIPKPIRPTELRAAVADWLSSSGGKISPIISKEEKTDQIIDISVYEDLKKFTRSDSVIEIYEEFENETSDFIGKLNFLVPAKNYPEILSILHTIKGNAGSLGLLVLADHTRQMEGKLKEARYKNLLEDFDLLKREFSNFVDNYKRLLK